MSLFNSVNVACPGCGTVRTFDLVASVNADRRPDLRAAILDGSFQKQVCDGCGSTFRPPPALTYVDVGRGAWLMVGAVEDAENWTAFEAQARATFAKAYGTKAPLMAQEIGAAMHARLTFGWAGLVEKLLCGEHGLDDVQLELLKLAIMRQAAKPPLEEGMELRLVAADIDRLDLAWIKAEGETMLGTIHLPRGVYDEVAMEDALWQPLRQQFAGAVYVDLNRLIDR